MSLVSRPGSALSICFYGRLKRRDEINYVSYYTDDVRILRELGYRVHVATRSHQLRPADLFFVWWWTWAFQAVAFARLLRRPAIVTGALHAHEFVLRSPIERRLIEYSFRRAWYEDLSEMTIQAVYSNDELGPVLHVISKPNGSLFVERKLDPRQFENPWQEIQGSGIRYAATVDGPDWRGELAIPWQAITADPNKPRPALLRFNFTQHKNLTGESASWAGPIDFGRDENFTGVLILRDQPNPGMGR